MFSLGLSFFSCFLLHDNSRAGEDVIFNLGLVKKKNLKKVFYFMLITSISFLVII
jgi:hypothetical protein